MLHRPDGSNAITGMDRNARDRVVGGNGNAPQRARCDLYHPKILSRWPTVHLHCIVCANPNLKVVRHAMLGHDFAISLLDSFHEKKSTKFSIVSSFGDTTAVTCRGGRAVP